MSHIDLEELFLSNLHLLCPDAPEPERQVKLIEGRKFSCDFYWPTHTQLIPTGLPSPEFMEITVWPVVVEIDGLAKQAGGGKHMSPADYEKINLLNLRGYCVLRFLGSMLRNDPYACISQVAQALGVQMRELS
jgi:hypothetical protein